MRTILEALNFEIATPDEAREMLGLKGRDNVGF
ncbi:3-keto-5-aminohexanoate cleavage protein [Pseudarthrobacter sp. Fe7]|nr:3-keto-5-aminohexanoate cleavage protein [Pseudarthrobacter sp. Fe7]